MYHVWSEEDDSSLKVNCVCVCGGGGGGGGGGRVKEGIDKRKDMYVH